MSLPLLAYLLSNSLDSINPKFGDNIRVYNSMFAFTLMSAKIDHTIKKVGESLYF